MNYRESQTNAILTVPDEVPVSARESRILQYDLLIYNEGRTPHWHSVADAVNAAYLGGNETKDSTKGVWKRFNNKVRKFVLKQMANASILDNIIPGEREITIDMRKAAMQQLLGTQYVSAKHGKNEGIKRRVLLVSDYHATVHPFIRDSLLNEEYDLCVHAGDILDMWQLHQSRIEGKTLTQQEQVRTLDEEFQIMRAWFELLDVQTHAQHIVLMGNHDARLYALFVKWLDPVLRSESLLHQMFKQPLELLTEGLENFVLGQREMEWTYPDGMSVWAANSQYLCQLGDALISHMNFTGKQPLTAVNKLYQWVQDHQHVLQMQNVRLLAQAHTHSLALDRNAQGGHVCLVETGCALNASALGYGLVYNGNWTPSSVGYVTFDQWQENGSWRSDLSSVQLHGVG